MKWTFLPAARFAEVAPQWDGLHALGPAAPMLTADFIGPLLRAFGSGEELVALCRDGQELLAAGLLTRRGRASWATFQPAQAPVGCWLQRPGTDTQALLASMLPALPGVALLAGLTQCDPFLLGRPADSSRACASDYIDTARIVVEGSVEDWWEGRSKNLRANLKKQRNRLAVAGTSTRLDIWRAPHHVAQAIADYGHLESTGWKGRAGTAVAADNDQGSFYRHMLEAFCRRGQGSIYRYFFGDQLVAMDLCIEDGDCIVILKTAYDESVPKHYSPALLMREEACRRIFEEQRFRRIEFYGKVMEWHTRWTDDVRTLYHLNHYRWPLLRRLHRALQHRAGTPD